MPNGRWKALLLLLLGLACKGEEVMVVGFFYCSYWSTLLFSFQRFATHSELFVPQIWKRPSQHVAVIGFELQTTAWCCCSCIFHLLPLISFSLSSFISRPHLSEPQWFCCSPGHNHRKLWKEVLWADRESETRWAGAFSLCISLWFHSPQPRATLHYFKYSHEGSKLTPRIPLHIITAPLHL